MFLEVNPLVLPELGLVIWSTIAFLVLLFVLTKFAWKPIMAAVKERETGIEEALAKAEKMKAEMAQLQNENEALLAKAREERATLIKEAKETADKMVAAAQEKAKAEYDRIVADAQAAIHQQKNQALTEVKNQVGSMVIEVAEKVLRKQLADKPQQEAYIQELVNGVKLN
ncbi:MAG TPA: ATP synthase F0 subunit B [Chitinophagaceae bacterium]|nr:ATP synthase F0 subunit B [Chitinophagaceae bacterium]HAN40271.1 ATP synthase F0 subunit B [Chitinophagaceae bacterium]